MITLKKLLFYLFFSLSLLLTPSLASNEAESEKKANNLQFVPPDAGKPSQTTPGGTRPVKLCPQDNSTPESIVTALVPVEYTTLTASAYPTFLVYIPQTSAPSLVFSIRDEQENYFYQQTIPLEGESGVISFQLPQTASPLEINQNYIFSFTLACQEIISPNDFVWSGQIKRVELTETFPSDSPLELANFYAQNGIWLDMLAIIAQERLIKPDDQYLRENWQQVLTSVGLESIVDEPLVR